MRHPAANVDLGDRAFENSLRQALQRNELQLAYQPQVSLHSGELVGVEALLRWESPEFGAVAAERIVPVAERAGLIGAIDSWVLQRACLVARKWQRLGLPAVRLMVNVSAAQLQAPDFATRLERLLADTGLEPRRLGIELTEAALMHDIEGTAAQLRRLHTLGLETALDDFGTGYSSLGHLTRLPLDVVKIDRFLTPAVASSPDALPIVRAIIAMAHSLGLKVVAVGVSNEAQLELLAANHCDFMQGNHFSKPVSAEHAEAMLQAGRGLPVLERRRAARTHRLLAVDPDPQALERLRRRLAQHFGDRVDATLCTGSAEALVKLSTDCFDLVVCNLQVPEMDGIALLGKARQVQPAAVRIMTLGPNDLARVIDDPRQVDVFRYVVQPSTATQFIAHFGAALEQLEKQRAEGTLLLAALPQQQQASDRVVKELMQLEQSEPGITRGPLDELVLPTSLPTMPGDLWVPKPGRGGGRPLQ